MALTYTYDPTVTSGSLAGVYTLRRLLADTDFSNVPTTLNPIPRAQQSVLFSNEEYLAFLAENNNDIMYTWSEILLAIASNRAIMSIYVSLGGGGDVDFRQVAQTLMSLSQSVIDRYINIPAEDIAEVDTGGLAAWRIAQNKILRDLT